MAYSPKILEDEYSQTPEKYAKNHSKVNRVVKQTSPSPSTGDLIRNTTEKDVPSW